MFTLSDSDGQAWADYKEYKRKRSLPARTAEECLKRMLETVDKSPCTMVHHYTGGPYCTTHCCYEPCVIGDSLKVLNACR